MFSFRLLSLFDASTVKTMGVLLNRYRNLTSHGAELLLEIKTEQPKPEDIAQALGDTFNNATKLIRNARFFTTAELHEAAAARLSVEKLATIAKYCRKLSNLGVPRDNICTEFLRYGASATTDELGEYMRIRVTKLNEQLANKPRASYARFSKTPDIDGMHHVMMKLTSEQANRMLTALNDEAKALFHQHHASSIEEARAQLIVNRVSTPAAGSTPDNHYGPLILIPLAETVEHIDGTVATTTGGMIDLAEYADLILKPHGYTTIAYKTTTDTIELSPPIPIRQRLASDEQRLISIAGHLMCVHPDCRIPAQHCQQHHITAFSQGGATEQNNLAPLCKRHNMENDDNPAKPKNGRIEKDLTSGRIGHRRTPTSPLRFNRAPIINKSFYEVARRLLH
ncbi:MAG: HNH endonuclease signature motif containing protein [Corynebacterium sp.]|uniref:HNH endonuclease signature motif containing protein n=1 Tax=Corynebacterium sp. TaxID=1720 RepID=UPI0026DB506B|nr:HNH endonuclease signature motif containing protein [Corynebacterium sp.]MDO5098008.1 HNH endonuclease signature motif containing protein [Corynebacterium sp.]